MSAENKKEGQEGVEEPQADVVSTAEESRSASGVDRTMIRWFLSLTPLERLRTVENYIASIEKMRSGRWKQ